MRLLASTTAAAFFLMGCASGGQSCPRDSDSLAEVSLLYESRGPVGLVQELSYLEGGVLKLSATNGKAYCVHLAPERGEEISRLLEDPSLVGTVRSFGDEFRFPEECFIPEHMTVQLGAIRRTARVDALRGSLLTLAQAMQASAREAFGGHYSVDIIDRATNRLCS